MLLAVHAVVDVDHKYDAVDACGYAGEVHQHLLRILHAAHGASHQIVAAVVDAPGCVVLMVEEDDLLLGGNLSAGVQHEDGCVDIHIHLGLEHTQQAAALLGFLPAQADHQVGELRAVFFRQINFLTLLQ